MMVVAESKKQKDFNKEIIPLLDVLYNFALKLTNDPNDAEDLVQDSIVKAYRFFGSYEKGTNAKAWVFRILKNSFINNYRKTETTDLERLMFQELMDDDISKALSKLPEDFRTVVLLCDVESYTYEEIANMLDVPIGTIRSRLHRGRNLLKTELMSYATKRGFVAD